MQEWSEGRGLVCSFDKWLLRDMDLPTINSTHTHTRIRTSDGHCPGRLQLQSGCSHLPGAFNGLSAMFLGHRLWSRSTQLIGCLPPNPPPPAPRLETAFFPLRSHEHQGETGTPGRAQGRPQHPPAGTMWAAPLADRCHPGWGAAAPGRRHGASLPGFWSVSPKCQPKIKNKEAKIHRHL